MNTHSLIIDLAIQADEYVRLYQGTVRDVVARASNGQTVRFPADILRPLVLRDGIHGRFRIAFDDRGKFVSIERLVGRS